MNTESIIKKKKFVKKLLNYLKPKLLKNLPDEDFETNMLYETGKIIANHTGEFLHV